jgi:hypothetical protein
VRRSFRGFARVSPADDAEDDDSDDDDNSHKRDVRDWSGISSNKAGCYEAGGHGFSLRVSGRASR